MKRNAIISMVDTVNPIIGAEIGAWKGDLTIELLGGLPNLTLYIIDLWDRWTPKDKKYNTANDLMSRTSAGDFRAIYQEVVAKIAPFDDRAVIKRGDSVRVAATCDDDYFDFVFIDAEHSEAALTLDIAAWYPKVKPGGWLCGHDYGRLLFPGVTAAVDTFAENINAVIEAVGESCWFIKK